jgi:hypothetical protein
MFLLRGALSEMGTVVEGKDKNITLSLGQPSASF